MIYAINVISIKRNNGVERGLSHHAMQLDFSFVRALNPFLFSSTALALLWLRNGVGVVLIDNELILSRESDVDCFEAGRKLQNIYAAQHN